MSQIDKVTAAATVYHSNRNDTVIFQSIKSTVRTTGLSEFFLRRLLKEGKLPGVYSGKKFLVNVPSLLELLNTSTGEVKTDEQQ